jgi:peroxiredoxin Q/BCP
MKTMIWGVAALFGLGIVLGARTANAADLKVGDKAPDFTLKASDGKTYNQADFKGKKGVVIAWFPKAFTGGCTAECKSFKENSGTLKATNVAYFTASVDPVEGDKGNKAFAESLSVDYPILSDPEKTTAKAYGVLAPAGYSNRWTFYIDKGGVIKEIDKIARTVDLDYPILSDPEKTTAKAYGVLNARGMSDRVTFYIDKEGVIKEIDKTPGTAKAGESVVAKIKSLGIGG